MLKLFKVTVGNEPMYFQRKVDAKIHRDAGQGRDGQHSDRVVMRGPDHWRGESFNKSTRSAW